MEDKKGENRLKSFMEIGLMDPIKMCEKYLVSLRKKRFTARSNLKRGITFEKDDENSSNHTDKLLLLNFDQNLDTVTQSVQQSLLSKAQTIANCLTESKDCSEIESILSELNKLCERNLSNEYDQDLSNSLIQSICEELFVLQKVLIYSELELSNEVINCIIKEVNNVISCNENSLEVQYHAFNVFINLTSVCDIPCDFISELVRLCPPSITQLIWIVSNICCCGFHQTSEILNIIEIEKVCDQFIENECFCKVLQKYSNSHKRSDLKINCKCVFSEESELCKVSKYIELVYILSLYSESFIECKSYSLQNMYISLMKKQILRLRSSINYQASKKIKIFSFSNIALISLKRIFDLNKFDQEIEEMIFDEDFYRDVKKILMQNNQDNIKSVLELLVCSKINEEIFNELKSASFINNLEIQKLICKIICQITDQDYSDMILMIDCGLANSCISYIDSFDYEVKLCAVITISKLYYHCAAHLLPTNFINSIISLANSKISTDLLSCCLWCIEWYLQNDFQNEEETEVSCASTFVCFGGIELLNELFHHQNSEICTQANNIYRNYIDAETDEIKY